MSNHPTEPWFIGTSRITNLNICYTDSDGHEAIIASPNFNFSNHHVIARRIVACVNALAGVPTEWLEKFSIAGSENVAQENARLTKQRDELLESLEDLKREIILSDVDMDYIESHFRYWLDKASIAIDKAKGGAVNHFPDVAKMVPGGSL